MVRSQRAQLILVGSIAIAIVLIGLTIVLNSAVFTENVAGGSSPTVTDEVTQFDREAVRNVRSLAVRINHASVYSGAGETAVDADVRENVSTYSRLLAQSYADTGSVYVNVTYEGTETFGNRIVQAEDGNITSNTSAESWTPIDEPRGVVLGRFVMNVDVKNSTAGEPFFLNLTDASGSTLNVSMEKTTEGELDVNSSIDGGNYSDGPPCTPKNGRVLLDVVHGTAYTGDCSFNSTGHLDEPYTRLHFENAGELDGKYDLVMNRSDTASVNGVDDCPSTNDPCRSVAAWSVNVTTRYDRGTFSFERNHNVTVYDP